MNVDIDCLQMGGGGLFDLQRIVMGIFAHTQRPKTLRPWAGSATVNLASMATRAPESLRRRTTAVRSTTCWPGVSIHTSPPFAPCHVPPPSLRTSSLRPETLAYTLALSANIPIIQLVSEKTYTKTSRKPIRKRACL